MLAITGMAALAAAVMTPVLRVGRNEVTRTAAPENLGKTPLARLGFEATATEGGSVITSNGDRQEHDRASSPSGPADVPDERPTSLDRFFLTQRFVNEHPAAPSGIAIVGPGEGPDVFTKHYYDSRGVARVYQMSLDRGVWTVWREAPGFSQRYTGVISDDGSTITGAWEGSADGRDWTHDFGLNYIKNQ